MPFYDYQCQACDTEFTRFRRVSESTSEGVTCDCGSSEVTRVIAACAFTATGCPSHEKKWEQNYAKNEQAMNKDIMAEVAEKNGHKARYYA